MKALAKLKPEEGIDLIDAEEPTPKHGELKVKIRKTAICGTDIHIYNWDDWAQQHVPYPMIIGHEFCGEVVEVGDGVDGFVVGDRISGEAHVSCGYCRNCRGGREHLCRNTRNLGVTSPQGCFAEYFVLPAHNAFKLSPVISDDIAAIFDPFGNATHTALSFDLVGEDVLITGAGPVGCLAVAVARHAGARHIVITDLNEYRLDLARQMGATLAVNPTEKDLSEVISDLGMNEGFDVGMEMSGSPQAFNSMIDHMNHGGRIGLLAFLPDQTQIQWSQISLKGLRIKGIYGREMFETWYKMANMIECGVDLSPMITHQFAIDDFQQGFDIMKSGKSGKVILNW